MSGLPQRRFPPSTPYTSRRFTLVATLTVLAVLFAVVTSRPNSAASEQADGSSGVATSLIDATGAAVEARPRPSTDATPTTAPTTAPTTVPDTAPTSVPTTTAPVSVVPSAASVGPWPGPGQVALTFDDGPDPTWTAQILDVLDRYQVPSTFFVLGSSAETWPDLVVEMARRGHSVQNHSYSHPYLTQLGDDGILGQLSGTSDVIEQILGARPSCYRPPYGVVDARVDSLAASLGMAQVGWNVAPNDYLRPPPEVLVSNVMARAAELPGEGLVVVLHDGGGDRSSTLASLPGMIEALSAAGYSFVSLC